MVRGRASKIFFYLILVLSAALTRTAEAQVNPFGLLGFLNPEGSRLFPSALIAPRHPGKPDPRWRYFDWRFIDLKPHDAPFRLYFYEEERWTARYALPEIENQIAYLKTKFNGFVPPKQFNYLLFTSHREFQQTNAFNISEHVQGVTSTLEPTMAIPYWGEAETFNHISTHEMVHQFQVQKLANSESWSSPRGQELTPLWFIEGMAEYYSLKGMDPETQAYMRDLILYPDKDFAQTLPKFFEDTIPTFVQVYKVGQTKIDFFETEFGVGTTQKILNAVAGKLGTKYMLFSELVATELSLTVEDIEKRWNAYIDKNFRNKLVDFKQKLADYEEVKDVPDTMDLYDISPDGKWLMTREIDSTTGVTEIQLRDTADPSRKTRVATDFENRNLKLYFLQMPTFGLSDSRVYYFAESISGPELVVRDFSSNGDGSAKFGNEVRYKIYRHELIEAHSPALSHDGKTLAFVGLDKSGRANVYKLDATNDDPMNEPKPLTSEVYSWKNLAWNSDGIYSQSDRTSNGKTAIYRINPQTAEHRQLTWSPANQASPDHNEERTVFESMEGESSQIHMLRGENELRITDAQTALTRPRLRGKSLYVIGLRSGRYRLYKIPTEKWLSIPVRNLKQVADKIAEPPYSVHLADLNNYKIEKYSPFKSSGTRLDNLSGFLSTGSVIGVSASVSDLMRDYSISGDFYLLGGIKNSQADLLLSSSVGRSTWTTGVYYTIRREVDTQFSTDNDIRTYLNREYGALFALQYPLGPFTFTDGGIRVAGVNRTDFSDSNLAPAFEATNPGSELMLAPIFRLGYDTILYEAFTGPLKGFAAMAEAETDYYPRRSSLVERARLDMGYYWQIKGPTVLAFQLMSGGTWNLNNGTFRNPFFISSPDIFRAYPFNDDRLLGNYVLGGKTEFRYPIGTLFGFPPLRGLVYYDLGSIFIEPGQLGTRVASSWGPGLNLNIPPLSIGFIWALPIRVAPGPKDNYITHFVLRYLYL